ncbi:hypothetical protein LL912_17095 [Niabella sp. CC-SYL272]|uniref:hypothetical protein n=1 Tax=Niabella agricola TaxID=2891571 RepID=UPI001F27D38D|nr:hypothetical protein [Niabella agricola]MCF3110506.1 hypothetical protein [Niabella agricola]
MLTNKQIQYLEQFCEQKGVQYYDLRMEMVDHLATELEEEMQRRTDINFPSLVHPVFESFGKNGFRSIVEAKEISIEDAYTRCHRNYFWSFFTPPKMILTLFMAVCLCLPFVYAGEKVILQMHRVYYLLMAFICVLTILGIVLQPGRTSKPLFLLKGVKRKSLCRNTGLLLVLFVNGYTTLKKDIPGDFKLFAMIFLLFVTIMYSLIFIARYYAVIKIYAKAKQDYPLAFMKKTF